MSVDNDGIVFGELNASNNCKKLHGRGIYIFKWDDISIAYWDDACYAPGSYVLITWEDFEVGEFYVDDEILKSRYT